jgi:hypothetical protein
VTWSPSLNKVFIYFNLVNLHLKKTLVYFKLHLTQNNSWEGNLLNDMNQIIISVHSRAFMYILTYIWVSMCCLCFSCVEGEVLKLGRSFLYPNRLEFYHQNRDGQVMAKGFDWDRSRPWTWFLVMCHEHMYVASLVVCTDSKWNMYPWVLFKIIMWLLSHCSQISLKSQGNNYWRWLLCNQHVYIKQSYFSK